MWLAYATQQAWLASLATITGDFARAEAWLLEVLSVCVSTEREPSACLN